MKHNTTLSEQKKQCNAHFANVIGTVVKKIRETAHLSAKECQHETGINISMVECGKRKLHAQSICRLCGFFGISKQKFYGLVEEKMGNHCSFFPDKVPTNLNVIKHKAAIERLFIKHKFNNN